MNWQEISALLAGAALALLAWKAPFGGSSRFHQGEQELPEVQQEYVDNLIDQVLESPEGASAWLDHKKLVIAEVFANGEAWLNANGDLVEKDDPSVAAHVTFSVIRAAMMKFYAAGIKNLTQEDD